MADTHSASPEECSARLAELTAIAMELAQGDFSRPVPIPEIDDSFAELRCALELIRHECLHQIELLTAAKEQIIAAQQETIQALSNPVIQIWQDILVAPVIGEFDRERAERVLEGVTQAIAERQAWIVILDLTGVPALGVEAASLLLKTAQAARLLGATCVLTGLSPASAQILSGSGLPLDELHFQATLQGGLQLALRLTRRSIVEVS